MTVQREDALQRFYGALLEDDAEQLYDSAPCGYLSTMPDGTVVKVNQTFLSLTGHRREDLVGSRRFVDLLAPGGRIYHETHFAPMLQMQGSAHEIAFDLVRADGSRLPVLVNSVLVRDDEGRPVTVRTAVFDATHRREYERQLLQAKLDAEAAQARAVALASTLQQTLVPPSAPVVPGLEVAAAYRPAGRVGAEVGGDFYDVFQVGDGDWVVAIGDVCGKGVQAAVVTALVRYTLRAAAVQHDQPSAALAVLNEVLLRHETDRFCTVAMVRLRQESGGWHATMACGGHPLPLLRRADGSVSTAGARGTLLGVMPSARTTDTEVRLGPGDGLLVLTDGVPEARRGDEFFGDDRVASVLGGSPAPAADPASPSAARPAPAPSAARPAPAPSAARSAPAPSAAATVDELLRQVLEFQGGSPRDDIAIVAVRVPA